jgi:hypothetical protein
MLQVGDLGIALWQEFKQVRGIQFAHLSCVFLGRWLLQLIRSGMPLGLRPYQSLSIYPGFFLCGADLLPGLLLCCLSCSGRGCVSCQSSDRSVFRILSYTVHSGVLEVIDSLWSSILVLICISGAWCWISSGYEVQRIPFLIVCLIASLLSAVSPRHHLLNRLGFLLRCSHRSSCIVSIIHMTRS